MTPGRLAEDPDAVGGILAVNPLPPYGATEHAMPGRRVDSCNGAETTARRDAMDAIVAAPVAEDAKCAGGLGVAGTHDSSDSDGRTIPGHAGPIVVVTRVESDSIMGGRENPNVTGRRILLDEACGDEPSGRTGLGPHLARHAEDGDRDHRRQQETRSIRHWILPDVA
jgi:hypothetical protein